MKLVAKMIVGLIISCLLANVTPSVYAATVNGYVIGVLQFKRSKDLDKEFSSKKLAKTGWKKTRKYYQKVIEFPNFFVSLDNGERYKLSKESLFSLDASPGDHIVYIFDMDGREVDNRKVFVENDDETLHLPIILLKDVAQQCCLTMNKRGGNAPPCLDYNGRFGTCEDLGGWRRFRNFIASDCAAAMGDGHCWTEVMPGPGHGCNHDGDNCSHFIGHPAGHHCHTNP